MLAPYSGITINSARRLLRRNFEEAGIEDAALEARILVGHAAEMDPAMLAAHGTDFLLPEQFEAVSDYAARRLSGEPSDMILGYRDFWKDRFTINADVLSPRPETEGIIEQAVKMLPPRQNADIDILELGVGSGALILSLLREYPKARARGVDISEAALDVARGNAAALGLDCAFMQSDWLDAVQGRYDLIVANPPYIDSAAMAQLSAEVRAHDPHIALHGGGDGLDPYRIITGAATASLKPSGGVLIFEIGFDQGRSVADMIRAAGLSGVEVIKDLSGHDRVVCGLYKE